MIARTVDRVRSLAELLAWRATHQPDEPAVAFLGRDLAVTGAETYGSLFAAAASVARTIRAHGAARAPVVLAGPPGLDFVRALWGVWLGGGIAVPSYPATNERTARRLAHIIRESGARLLIDGERADRLGASSDADGNSNVDRNGNGGGEDHADGAAHGGYPPEDSPAIIQYTSGSLGHPKGVVLTHRNILSNAQQIYRAFFHTSKSRGLIWLPPYHDMGLMGGLIQPVYGGFRTCLMAPRTFLRDPLNWLRAVTLTQATTSGGPNFAYELCAGVAERDIEAAGLRLDAWQVAFNGAEPVSKDTMVRFAKKFEPYGFKMRRFMPCYGLAEATLYVSGASKVRGPTFLAVDRALLRRGEARTATPETANRVTLVSNGIPDLATRIVHREERRPCRAAEIGEIWVSGESVGRAYCGDDEASADTFEARLAPDGPAYLRTGDLGFLLAGELYVTGRLKDLIIIRGQNHHPEDIEATARAAHVHTAALPAAAFSVAEHVGDRTEERLVIVQEVARERSAADHEAIIDAVRVAVSAEHGLSVAAVTLVARGGIPKTLSGKIRRQACAERLLARELPEAASWHGGLTGADAGAPAAAGDRATPIVMPAPALDGLSTDRAVERLSAWLMHVVSGTAQLPIDDLDANAHFGLYGLDSLTAVSVTATVSHALAVDLEETAFWDYPNFNLLAAHLVARLRAPGVGGRTEDEVDCPSAVP